MRIWNMVVFLTIVFILGIMMPTLKAQEDFKLFNEAMDLRIQREWDNALKKYELLKLNYPDSKYIDDAEFWSAYIFEEQGKENEAFLAYQQMKDKHPNSPWADDATMHQIGLAEKFVKQGQDSYKQFLTENLESPYKNIRYQAALSLGKLGDERAIPVLKEISNNSDKGMRSVGNSLLQKFDHPAQQDRRQLEPMPISPPKTKPDKKNDVIKKPSRMEPQNQQQLPKLDRKNIRPTPKQQPQRSTPPKTTGSKKAKISQFLEKDCDRMNPYMNNKSLARKGETWTEYEFLRHIYDARKNFGEA